MIKNIAPFGKFKNNKKNKVNELVEPFNDMYRVTLDVDVPKSLINSYIKKVKDETNKDLRQSKSEMQLAQQIVQYVNENYIVIENIPVNMVVSTDQKAVQGQAQSQIQSQTQTQTQDDLQFQDDELQIQPQSQKGQSQVQVQTQPQGQTQVQPQGGQAQIAAQEIPSQEI